MDPTKRQQRKLKLRTRAERKAGAPILKWKAKGVPPEKQFAKDVYTIILDPDFEIKENGAQTPAYLRLEEEIQKMGVVIIEKSSNQFEDSLVVIVSSEHHNTVAKLQGMPGIDIVSPRPKPKALISIDGVSNVALIQSGVSCSAAAAANQAAIIDTINAAKTTVTNSGGSVNVIVWDFLPENLDDLKHDELLGREAGGYVVFPETDSSGDIHGGAVASTCCGKNAGLASGANLILLQLTNTITNDLGVIESICATSTKPVVVNMSWALEYHDVTSAGDQTAVKNSIAALDDLLDDMKSRYPRLMFVVAAGNETLNTCDTTSPTSYGSGQYTCNDCYFWPQSRLGEPYSVTDVPFVMVGATQVFESSPHQRMTSYSNYGACVHAFAHGSTICALNSDDAGYRGIDGTSFSAPLFSSLAALRFSQQPTHTTDDVVSYLLSTSADTVELSQDAIDAGTTSTFAHMAEGLRTGGQEPTPYDGGSGDFIGKDVVPIEDPITANFWFWALIACAVILILGAGMYYYRSKGSSKGSSQSPV